MSRHRPQLRNGVDRQLHTAFNDGNWPVVVRLAEKRARAFNDQYFEIVRICAESQLDDPDAKFAAVAAVRQFVRDATVVKDLDAIDLLEWATLDLIHDDDFAEALGPLRVRAVKASPRDRIAATRCLESCLLHWDLVSAQQIAAIMDRSFPGERAFLFWNIVITHMLAPAQKSPQSSPEKQKLYGTLAQKQIERAAQLTEQARVTASADKPPTPPSRGIRTEEEILMLFDVVETHGSAGDFEKLLASPVFSPVSQFRLGRKELFLRVVAKYHGLGDWETVFNLCNDCLSDADENDEPTLLASDTLVWRYFLDAATHLQSVNPDTCKKVQDLLLTLAKSKNMRPIHKRNILLARVSAAFLLGPGDGDDLQHGQPFSLRLRELIHYIDDQKFSSACFDDIKTFAERLDASAIAYIAHHHIPQLADAASDAVATARLRLLSLKMQYFASTCPLSAVRVPGPRPRSKCTICDAEFDTALCASCLSSIGRRCLALYQSTAKDLAGNSIAKIELAPELAMAVAFCHLKLAFNATRPGYALPATPCPRQLIRALFILERQLRLTPKHSQISLILVQLHLLLGSAPRSREIWDGLAVKRAIVDSLAPFFFDRLSTISPMVLSMPDDQGWELIETLKSHYAASLKLRMPRRLIDAFEAGSYTSIMDMPKYMEGLRASCTRAMTLAEEARAARLLGQPCEELLSDARFTEVPDELCLKEVVDYGSFPSWDCSSCVPVYERLRIGPPPSNQRSHLSLLSEAFHNVLDYRSPSAYKVASEGSATEYAFVLEMMARLGHSFSKFLHSAAARCTPAEMLYFEAVSLLCVLVPLCTSICRTRPLPDVLLDVLCQVTQSLRASLESPGAEISAKEGHGVEEAVSTLMSLHSTAMLRDTAAAVNLALRWILSFHEREKGRDRSGRSSLPKEAMAQIKSLQAAADAAMKDSKARSNTQLGGKKFVDALRAWVFEDEVVLGAMVDDGMASQLVESWRMNVKGWQQIQAG